MSQTDSAGVHYRPLAAADADAAAAIFAATFHKDIPPGA